jgi:hypothetical protein
VTRQIDLFCTARLTDAQTSTVAPNGGSASGYQPDFAQLTLGGLHFFSNTPAADPYIYTSALRGEVFRFYRPGEPEGRHRWLFELKGFRVCRATPAEAWRFRYVRYAA